MKKQIITLLTAAMAAAGATAAPVPAPNDQGMYIGVEGALANTSGLETLISSYEKTSETTSAGALRLFAGYQFNSNWGLELGYFHTGDFKQSGLHDPWRYDFKYNYQGIDAAGIYKFTEGVPGLFLKAGITYAQESESVTYQDDLGITGSNSYSVSGNGYLFGLGYEFNIDGGLAARLGYTRYGHLAGLNGPGTNVNLFSAGLKYAF